MKIISNICFFFWTNWDPCDKWINLWFFVDFFWWFVQSETNDWYNTMLSALPPDDYLSDLATRYYEGCSGKGRTIENGTEVLALLSEAIRIAPIDCPILLDCHLLRADILIKAGNYEVGSNRKYFCSCKNVMVWYSFFFKRAIIDLNVCKYLCGSKFNTNLPLLINLAKCFIQTNNRTNAEQTIELLRCYRRKYNCTKKGKSELFILLLKMHVVTHTHTHTKRRIIYQNILP